MNKKIEENIKIKSNGRCVFCHKETERCCVLDKDKVNDEDNYILLCDICANKYIGNKDLIKQLKQRRDYWYKQIEEASKHNQSIEIEKINADSLSRNRVILYHVVYEHEGLKETAETIHRMLYHSQESTPNHLRILCLDIDGHVDEYGEFDDEMKELQQTFILENLLPYFEEIRMPIIDVKNPEPQKNDIPKEFYFISNDKDAEKLYKNKLSKGAYIIENLKKEYGQENRMFIYNKK